MQAQAQEPFARFNVNAVFHGHAHAGSPEGRAHDDIPVYNVAMPLLARHFPDAPPFRLLELTLIRVGNEEYVRSNQSYGLTTLRDNHVKIYGSEIRAIVG